MKEHYEELYVEVMRFEPADVIITSPTTTPAMPATGSTNNTEGVTSFF